MQSVSDPTTEALADAAIKSSERHFEVFLTVDWNRDGGYSHRLSPLHPYLSEVSVDRSLSGSTPADLTIIDGAASAELSFTISGFDNTSKLSFDSVFSPYQSTSPFWGMPLEGCEVTYWLGIQTALGMAWYRQFVGNVRTIEPDRASGTVTITALDRAEKLRKPVTFQAWAVYDLQAGQGQYESQLTDSSWIIDHCLRLNDVSPTPYRPIQRSDLGLLDDDVTGPQIWVNGTGSVLPTVGWLDNQSIQTYPYDTEPSMYRQNGAVHPSSPEPATKTLEFSARGAGGNDTTQYYAADRDRMTSIGSQILGFTLDTSDPAYLTVAKTEVLRQRAADSKVISIFVQTGKVWTEYHDEVTNTTEASSHLTIPAGTSCRIYAIWDYYNPSGATVYIKAGTVDNAGSTVVGGVKSYTAHPDDQIRGLMVVRRVLSIQDIHFTSTNYGSLAVPGADRFAGYNAKYAAVLDPGLNRLSYTPSRSGDDAWQVITDVASAEFGSVFWDENGVFRFWNYDRLVGKQTNIVRTLTLDDVSGLKISRDLDSVRNILSVTNNRKRSTLTRCIEAQDINQFIVPPFTQVEFRIWQDDVSMADPGKLPRYATTPDSFVPSQWSDDVDHGYVVQFLSGGTWQEMNSRSSGVDIFSYLDWQGNVLVRVYNGYGDYCRLAAGSTDPTPALRVAGTRVYSLDAVISTSVDYASRNKYGPRNLPLSGDWYQDSYDANGLAGKLLSRTVSPVPTTDAITIAGDPRLQLGDTVRIEDRDGFGTKFDAQIYGITRTFSLDGGLEDTLTVQLVAPGGIWDDDEYGIWDSTFLWS
jgi:hypothetical protein